MSFAIAAGVGTSIMAGISTAGAGIMAGLGTLGTSGTVLAGLGSLGSALGSTGAAIGSAVGGGGLGALAALHRCPTNGINKEAAHCLALPKTVIRSVPPPSPTREPTMWSSPISMAGQPAD